MQILNLYPEDFENLKTWRDVCDVLEIHPESTEASILFVRASSESIPQVNEIAIIWDINDVKSIDPDLSDDDCREVLIRAQDDHDANEGINWNVLESHVNMHKDWSK